MQILYIQATFFIRTLLILLFVLRRKHLVISVTLVQIVFNPGPAELCVSNSITNEYPQLVRPAI